MAISRTLFGFLTLAMANNGLGGWLQGKEIVHVDSLQGNCPPKQIRCQCGVEVESSSSFISIKQCPFSTDWGQQLCEPCQTRDEAEDCLLLQHCSRCAQYNPQAVCEQCPPGRYGDRCEQDFPCTLPKATEHMTLHTHVTRKGIYKLEIRCEGGRIRQGPKTVRCLPETQTWNKDPPDCVLPKLCETLSEAPIPFTRLKLRTSELAVYECDAGYHPTGTLLQTSFQCQNGVWVRVGENINCKVSPGCNQIPTFVGAQLVPDSPLKSSYAAGEYLQFECEEGFEPMTPQSNFSLSCVDKNWKGQVPECELKGCPKFKVEQGEVTYNHESNSSNVQYVSINSIAVINCLNSYTLRDAPKIVCSSTGKWQPEIPKCFPKVCVGNTCKITAPVNAIAETAQTEILPGQIVNFRCKDGMLRKLGKGDKQRICLFNRTLSSSDIECVPAHAVCKIVFEAKDDQLQMCVGRYCKTPGRNLHQDKNFEYPEDLIPFGSEVEFSCRSQYYRLDGKDSAQCLDSPPKDIKAPRCEPVCGKREFPKNARIRGGENVSVMDWPWQAGLYQVKGQQVAFHCGATLIFEQWAITAAHCVTVSNSTLQLDSRELKLTYGLSSVNESYSAINSPANKNKYSINRTIPHWNYNADTLDNDIALLQLETPLEVNRDVGLACLPASLDCSNHRLVEGQKGMVTGWGTTELDPENMSNILREVQLAIVSTTNCVNYFKAQGYNTEVVTDNMFCAISAHSAQDVTDGDSGGPFVVQGKGNQSLWVLEGIVSWGAEYSGSKPHRFIPHDNRKFLSDPFLPTQSCKGKACYGIYTRVAKYLQWISEKTTKHLPRNCA